MKLLTNIKQALSGAFKNKVRAFFAMLGISTAIASIILLVSLGQGVQARILSQVEELGADQILVVPMRVLKNAAGQHDFLRGMSAVTSNLTLDDVESIQQVPEVDVAVPQLESVVRAARVDEEVNKKIGQEEPVFSEILLTGTSLEYFNLTKLKLLEGEFFNPAGEGMPGAVLGSSVKESLFGEEPAVGRQVLLHGRKYKVLGVLESKNSVGLSFNERVYIPIEEAREITGVENLSMIFVQVKSNALVDEGERGISRALHRHKTQDFSLIKQGEMLTLIDNFTGTLNAMLIGIAGISLIIAAIGITNIMMLTAIERTREIGIRKVLGANTLDIFLQFLIESLVITTIAGLIGILAGWGFINALHHYYPGIPFKITWELIGRMGLAAVSVGILFGLYPAIRASLMQPARAIRQK